MKRTLLCTLMLLAPALFAQTYTPKTIRIEGVPEADRAAVMQKLALPEQQPLTKQQIEEGMGRLADTGNYTDLSYKVDSQALVITVKAAEGSSQALPVAFENLVWWEPAELEKLLEAKVPLYHGQLPLTGSLTDEVRKALEALLADKGVAGAQVEVSMRGGRSGIGSMAVAVTSPHVLVGKVTLPGTAPDAAAQMDKVIVRLEGREFERDETQETVRANTIETHRNAGYLDAAVDVPAVSAPRKDGGDYVVDLNATVHPAAPYRVTAVSLEPIAGDAQGVKADEILKAAEIRSGDVAGTMTLAIGEGTAARVLQAKGMLEAKVSATVAKDPAAHTVAYRFTCVPGPVYTVERVDVSAMLADVAAKLAKAIGVQPGVRADADVLGRIFRALRDAGLEHKATVGVQQVRASHTAVYVIRPAGAAGR